MDTFRSFETIPNLDSKNSVIKCADNTLSAQNSQQILADNFVLVVLLPLVGAIEILKKNESKIVDSGEIAYIFMKPDEQIFIQNPYENELINYLELRFKQDCFFEEEIIIEQFDLEKNRNRLIDISTEQLSEKIFIGKYDGREEETFLIDNQAFVFVINGVFECQNRLIESRSALSLWNNKKLEFEGLGRENIILIIS